MLQKIHSKMIGAKPGPLRAAEWVLASVAGSGCREELTMEHSTTDCL